MSAINFAREEFSLGNSTHDNTLSARDDRSRVNSVTMSTPYLDTLFIV